MQTHQALDGRVDVFKLGDSLMGGPESDEVVARAKDLAANGRLILLVDMGDVRYINSLGLTAITRLVITASKVNGAVKVCRLSDRVRHLFDIVRFNQLFQYYESESAALEAIARELPGAALAGAGR